MHPDKMSPKSLSRTKTRLLEVNDADEYSSPRRPADGVFLCLFSFRALAASSRWSRAFCSVTTWEPSTWWTRSRAGTEKRTEARDDAKTRMTQMAAGRWRPPVFTSALQIGAAETPSSSYLLYNLAFKQPQSALYPRFRSWPEILDMMEGKASTCRSALKCPRPRIVAIRRAGACVVR